MYRSWLFVPWGSSQFAGLGPSCVSLQHQRARPGRAEHSCSWVCTFWTTMVSIGSPAPWSSILYCQSQYCVHNQQPRAQTARLLKVKLYLPVIWKVHISWELSIFVSEDQVGRTGNSWKMSYSDDDMQGGHAQVGSLVPCVSADCNLVVVRVISPPGR